MTDTELKLALAKMLPEKIKIDPNGNPTWDFYETQRDWMVLDTEWLHVCHLIEQGLGPLERDVYYHELFNLLPCDENCGPSEMGGDDLMLPSVFALLTPTWQHRAEALTKTLTLPCKP